MAEQYYQTINGERVEIKGDDLTAKQTEWKADAAQSDAYDLDFLRDHRNSLLQDCDWVVIKAQEDGTAVPSAWVTYRQALRDITKNYSNLEEVVWPDKPE